jgi:hypothetical protein
MEDPSIWVYKDEENYDPKQHEKERVENGFSVYDWWNFNDYLSWVIVQGLKKFKDGAGFPVWGGIETMDDWREALDKMIAGFEAQNRLMNDYNPATMEADRAVWEEGSALFIKFYATLWD